MEPYTVSSRILTLHRAFAAYTSQRLQELGLNFGQMSESTRTAPPRS